MWSTRAALTRAVTAGRHVCRSKSVNLNRKSYLSVSSAPLSDSKPLKSGDRLHGYEVQAVEDIPELCLTTYVLNHVRTGAQHLHLHREDNTNLFAVTLRTTPKDDTGVAHILEHLALCGSEQYPVRDPFMKMLNRSLATFMNAFTSPDNTCYPFCTQNPKDFYNLMSIYLDAVFFPRLQAIDFRQEGWRLEHQTVDDPNSEIIFKGVVFNEMKGVFSSPSALYSRSTHNHILPSTTYAYESGGDPLAIPSLSYEQLKQFHEQHYHPSNARFITYGNFALENHLAFIDDKVLSRFERNDELKKATEITRQSKWSAPVTKSLECQPDPMAPFPDKQTTVSVSYLLEDITDTHETFTLAILCNLLMDGPNAPLFQALIESGLGSDYSPNSGFANYIKQSFFSIGLQGIAKNQINLVKTAIETALQNAISDGFPEERVEAVLHRIELSTKRQVNNYGLGLAMAINPLWVQDGDPVQGLRVNEHVNKFRQEMKKNPKLLQQKIKQYFTSNKHQLILEMSPSDNYEKNLKAKEENLLKEKLSELSKEDLKQIYEDGLELERQQKKPEDASLLPTLSVKEDISRRFDATNIETIKVGEVPIQWSAQPTNGITHFCAILKLKNDFPKDLVPYLPLFSQVMTKLGAGRMDRYQLDQEINMRTGGLDVSVHCADHPSQFDLYERGLVIGSCCLERNILQMFRLWTDLFNEIRFDDDLDYLLQLIKMSSAEMSTSIVRNGHRYAMNRSAASLGGAFKFRELTSGLSSVSHFRQMASLDSCEPVVQKLKTISSLLLNAESLRCAVNGEAPTIRPTLQIVENFVKSINKTSQIPGTNEVCSVSEIPAIESNLNEHNVLPFGVNYLGKSVFCAPFTHQDHAKLKIASKLVSAKYLHREIREKGGAYGGGAVLSRGGVFNYYSYRDPHVNQTIEAFKGSAEWLSDPSNYTDVEVDEAKLSTFQDVDSPVMPSDVGLEFFANGITDQMRHDYRMSLLDVTKADIEEVAKRYLLEGTLHSGVVLIGPRSELTMTDPKWVINEERPKD